MRPHRSRSPRSNRSRGRAARRLYQGSYYSMTHRATVLTRAHTSAGIVGTAYAADEEHTLHEIVKVARTEIIPKLIGQCPPTSSAAGSSAIPPPSISSAIAASVWWRSPGSTRHCGHHRSGHRPAAAPAVGRLSRDPAGQHHRRLLQRFVDVRGEVEAEVNEWLAMGFRGCKFKLGSQPTDVDVRGSAVARSLATTSSSRSMPTRATRRCPRALRQDPRARDPLVRGAVPLGQRRSVDA